MYDNTVQTDYVKSELEYRLGRIRADIAGRRARRLLSRGHSDIARAELGATTRTTAR